MPGKADPKRLRVTLNWSVTRSETISEKTAAGTLVGVIDALARERGIEVLKMLTALEIRRGYLLSTKKNGVYTPDKNKLNGYWVLTNNSTPEKVEILEKVRCYLNLPHGFFSIVQTK